MQAIGLNGDGQPWRVGIRNPFQRDELVKVLAISDHGVATSGTAIRGQHIYNPWQHGLQFTEVVSLTVIGPSIYDADRFATAAFAMGRSGSPSSPSDRIWRDTRLPPTAWRHTPAASTTMFARLLTLPDRWLDRVSMYRLVIVYLVVLLGVALGLSGARDPRLFTGRSRWLGGRRGPGVPGRECALRVHLWRADEQ